MYALGVDLGTTFTAAAVWRDGRAEICSLGTHSAAIPSVVLARSDGSVLTGEAAARRAALEPDRVAREFKRRLGDSTPLLLGGSPYSAEALTARLLRAVLDLVTAREGGAPASICVSHPANWGPFKTDLLRQAVRLADVRVPVIYTTEPEAAAVSYARQERLAPGDTVAVYDLGGGTFDAAVLRRTAAGFEILGQPEGIERLGGIDIDAAVFNHVLRSVGDALSALDEDDPASVGAVARLRSECTDAKEALSSDTDVAIPVMLPALTTEVRLTRAELENMVRPSLYDSIDSLKRAVRSAGVDPGELAAVLLVGGSSRMPLVAQLVGSELGRPVAVDAHPKHAIALGAAWLASGATLPVDPDAGGVAVAAPAVPRPSSASPVSPSTPAAPAAAGGGRSSLAAAAGAGAVAGAAGFQAGGHPAQGYPAPGYPAQGQPAAGYPAQGYAAPAAPPSTAPLTPRAPLPANGSPQHTTPYGPGPRTAPTPHPSYANGIPAAGFGGPRPALPTPDAGGRLPPPPAYLSDPGGTGAGTVRFEIGQDGRSGRSRGLVALLAVVLLAAAAVAGFWYLKGRSTSTQAGTSATAPVGDGSSPTGNAVTPPAGASTASVGAQTPPSGTTGTTKLTVTITGSGQVAGNGLCDRTCTLDIPRGQNSRFHAEAADGWTFSKWSNCARVSGPDCTVLPLHAVLTINAVFVRAGGAATSAPPAGSPVVLPPATVPPDPAGTTPPPPSTSKDTAPPVPGAVGSVTVSGPTSSTLEVNWTPATGATKYRIKWTSPDDPNSPWISKPPDYDGTHVHLIGLKPGTTYTITVTPYNDAGLGTGTSRSGTTTA